MTEPSIVIFTKPSCSWCIRAKELLREQDADFVEIDITKSPGCTTFLLASGLKTVPQIFDSGELIGDFLALQEAVDRCYFELV